MNNLKHLASDHARSLSKTLLRRLDPQRARALALGLLSLQSEEERVSALLDLGWDLPLKLRSRLVAELDVLPAEAMTLFETTKELARALEQENPEPILDLVRQFLSTTQSDPSFELSVGLREAILGSQSTVDHVINVYTGLARALTGAGASLRGRILELGPGHSLLGGILLLSWGMTRYDGVDAFPIAHSDARRVRALRERLVGPQVMPIHEPALAARREEILDRFDEVVSLEGDEAVLNEDLLRLHYPVDAADLPFEADTYDVVFSNAVLEHVRDVANTAVEGARVLKPGGLSIHQVDFRDHRDFSRPRAFLELSAREWEELLAETPFEYTNRQRLSDVRTAFEEAGLELCSLVVNQSAPIDEEERARLDEAFRGRTQEDLEALSALMIWRKPLS